MTTSSGTTTSAAPISASSPKGGSRLRYVDALRGIAALLVVWLHVAQSYGPLDPGNGGHYLYSVAQDFDVGRVGVVLFFLISGYVIPFSIPRDRPAPIGQFVIRRFFRVYPAYWLSVPLGAWAVYWLGGLPFGIREFLVNLTLLQDVFGVPPAQGVYWTLLVELAFYALCAFLFLADSLYKPIRVAVLAAILAFAHSLLILLIWRDMTLTRWLAPAFWCVHLSLMLCGTLYRHCTTRDGSNLAGGAARLLLYGLLIYYLAIFPAGAILAHGFLHNYAVSNAFGVLVFVVGTVAIRIETRTTDWLGAISYSIYLLHLVVYYPLFKWIAQQPAGSWLRAQHLGVYLLVNAGLTIALAAFVYRFVEKPGIALGHRLAERWAQRGTQPTTAPAISPIEDAGKTSA